MRAHLFAATAHRSLMPLMMAPENPPAATEENAGGGTVTNLPGGAVRVEGAGAPGADAATTDEATKLPEGYDNWEAYGKDVAAGKVKPPVAEPTAEEVAAKAAEEAAAKAAADQTPEQKVAQEALQTKLAPYDAEIAEKGELSASSITKAATEFGVTENMVKAYLAGNGLTAEARTAAVAAEIAPFHAAAGGPEAYAKFAAWADGDGGMTASEKATYNRLIESDPTAALEFGKPIMERFKSDGTANPASTLTRGPGEAPAGGDVYGSMAQQLKDQSDPRYKNDPAFRKEVEAKIGRSPAY